MGVGPDAAPLAEKQELAEAVLADLMAQALTGGGQGQGLATHQVGGPGGPAGAAVGVLERHEQGVVLQPASLLATKCLKRRPQPRRPAHLEVLPGASQDAVFEINHWSVI